jgi:hypothetical protein
MGAGGSATPVKVYSPSRTSSRSSAAIVTVGGSIAALGIATGAPSGPAGRGFFVGGRRVDGCTDPSGLCSGEVAGKSDWIGVGGDATRPAPSAAVSGADGGAGGADGGAGLSAAGDGLDPCGGLLVALPPPWGCSAGADAGAAALFCFFSLSARLVELAQADM